MLCLLRKQFYIGFLIRYAINHLKLQERKDRSYEPGMIDPEIQFVLSFLENYTLYLLP